MGKIRECMLIFLTVYARLVLASAFTVFINKKEVAL